MKGYLNEIDIAKDKQKRKIKTNIELYEENKKIEDYKRKNDVIYKEKEREVDLKTIDEHERLLLKQAMIREQDFPSSNNVNKQEKETGIIIYFKLQ